MWWLTYVVSLRNLDTHPRQSTRKQVTRPSPDVWCGCFVDAKPHRQLTAAVPASHPRYTAIPHTHPPAPVNAFAPACDTLPLSNALSSTQRAPEPFGTSKSRSPVGNTACRPSLALPETQHDAPFQVCRTDCCRWLPPSGPHTRPLIPPPAPPVS